MDIVIDFTPLIEFINLPFYLILWKIFIYGGWIPISIIFLWGFFQIWVDYIQSKWYATQKFILLAIDVPRNNVQTPKAVESIFAYLAGAHGSLNLIEKYWLGMFQLGFSFEIVSIDGYIQFLVYTPEKFKDLVESAIYSQYPDAEIVEVNDYTTGIPTKYPNEVYDVWGSEFILANKYVYPIKTYKEFGDPLSLNPETQFKDPMASLMDLCSSLKKGEQLWYQIVIKPIDFEWTKAASKEISKILGEKVASEKNIADKIIDMILNLLSDFSDMIYKLGEGSSAKEEKKDDSFKMMNLKPSEKRKIEAIEEKISKIGFEFKIRFVYVARKEVMNKPKVVNGFVGYMKQFIDVNLNNLKPDTKKTATTASYFLKDYIINTRKRKIVSNYKARSIWSGRKPGILNIEELATLWHFPLETVVKAPLIQKVPGRKAEPPMSLPVSDETVKEEAVSNIFEDKKEKTDRDIRKKDDFVLRVREKKEKVKKGNKKQEKLEQDIKQISEKNVKKGTPPDNLPFA